MNMIGNGPLVGPGMNEPLYQSPSYFCTNSNTPIGDFDRWTNNVKFDGLYTKQNDLGIGTFKKDYFSNYVRDEFGSVTGYLGPNLNFTKLF